MDVDKLFETMSVEEVKQLARRTRSDIEMKKEELRFLVGERYRDIIRAADTISDMKICSTQIIDSLSRLDGLCKTWHKDIYLHDSIHKKPTVVEDNSEKLAKASLAAQVKLLLDMPELIWKSTEDQNYLEVGILFLVARHLTTNLQLGGEMTTSRVDAQVIVYRQWGAIAHTRESVVLACRAFLQQTSVSTQQTCHALAALVFLEELSLEQILDEYFDARTAAIESALNSEQTNMTVKEQVIIVVSLLLSTLHQTFTLFYADSWGSGECSLLMKTLEEVSRCCVKDMAWAGGERIYRHLPPSVSLFQPSASHVWPQGPAQPAILLNLDKLKQKTQDWLQKCLVKSRSGISSLLVYVTTVSGVLNTRSAALQLLRPTSTTTADTPNKEDSPPHLPSPPEQLIGSLDLWTDLLRDLFINRLKEVLDISLNEAFVSWSNNVSSLITQLEVSNSPSNASPSTPSLRFRSLSSSSSTMPASLLLSIESSVNQFVWSESTRDTSIDSIWGHNTGATGSWRGYDKDQVLSQPGPLTMKFRVFTPAVQSISADLNDRITEISRGLVEEAGDDETVVRNLLKTAITTFINRLNSWVTQEAAKVTSSDADECSSPLPPRERQLMSLCRVCSALLQICPALLAAFLTPPSLKTTASSTSMSQSSSTKSLIAISRFSSSRQAATDLSPWLEVTSPLRDLTYSLCSRALNHMIEPALVVYRDSLNAFKSEELFLEICPRWDKIELEDEGETGERLVSTFRVPNQATWPVHDLLIAICQSINKIGGHSIPRTILVQLIEDITNTLIVSYEELLASGKMVDQDCLLQCMFDVKYVFAILSRKEDNQSNSEFIPRLHHLLESLEAEVDPFDLEVCASPLQSHLLRASQRACLLYGLVASVDRQGAFSSSLPHTHMSTMSSGADGLANLIPMACGVDSTGSSTTNSKGVPRFALLPSVQVPVSTTVTPSGHTKRDKVIKILKQSSTHNNDSSKNIISMTPQQLATKSSVAKASTGGLHQSLSSSSFYNRFGSMLFNKSGSNNIG